MENYHPSGCAHPYPSRRSGPPYGAFEEFTRRLLVGSQQLGIHKRISTYQLLTLKRNLVLYVVIVSGRHRKPTKSDEPLEIPSISIGLFRCSCGDIMHLDREEYCLNYITTPKDMHYYVCGSCITTTERTLLFIRHSRSASTAAWVQSISTASCPANKECRLCNATRDQRLSPR